MDQKFHIEVEREEDGRWIAEVTEMPGVLAYGWTEEDARSRVAQLLDEVLNDAIEIVREIGGSHS